MMTLTPNNRSAYERQFGEKNAKTGEWEFSATRLAMLNSLPLVTYAIGVVGASFIGERYGRRIVFVIINSFCLAGIALSYAGKSFDYAMAGRMIIQLHVGGEAWLVPMWMAEVVPAAVRGSSKLTNRSPPFFQDLLADSWSSFQWSVSTLSAMSSQVS
jgi:MFS family permease